MAARPPRSGSCTASRVASTTLLRAALPSIPVVNQLPGIRKSGDFDGLAFARPAVTVERRARHGVRRRVRLPGQGHRAADLPARPRLPAAHGDPDRPRPSPSRRSARSTWPTPSPGTVRCAIGETVTVTTRADEVRPHPKGRTVDVVTSVDAGGEVVWESTRPTCGAGVDDRRRRRRPTASDARSRRVGVTWRLAGDLGRRYAAVSGDHNPIHLYPLTAKALGFPRQIAHGMWSLARCVAALENRLPDAVHRRRGVQEADPPARHRSPSASRRTTTGSPSPSPHRRSGAPHLVGRTHAA